MRVLLREAKTRLYYVGFSQWTLEARHAHDFEAVEQALEMSHAHHLQGMEVVLSYESPACELVLPISPQDWTETVQQPDNPDEPGHSKRASPPGPS